MATPTPNIDVHELNTLAAGGFDSVEVTNVLSQESRTGSVDVVVHGSFTYGGEKINFTQSFSLIPRQRYVFSSDTLRFGDDEKMVRETEGVSYDFHQPDDGFEKPMSSSNNFDTFVDDASVMENQVAEFLREFDESYQKGLSDPLESEMDSLAPTKSRGIHMDSLFPQSFYSYRMDLFPYYG